MKTTTRKTIANKNTKTPATKAGTFHHNVPKFIRCHDLRHQLQVGPSRHGRQLVQVVMKRDPAFPWPQVEKAGTFANLWNLLRGSYTDSQLVFVWNPGIGISQQNGHWWHCQKPEDLTDLKRGGLEVFGITGIDTDKRLDRLTILMAPIPKGPWHFQDTPKPKPDPRKEAVASLLAECQKLDGETHGDPDHELFGDYDVALDNLQHALGWSCYDGIGWDDLEAGAEQVLGGEEPTLPPTARRKAKRESDCPMMHIANWISKRSTTQKKFGIQLYTMNFRHISGWRHIAAGLRNSLSSD